MIEAMQINVFADFASFYMDERFFPFLVGVFFTVPKFHLIFVYLYCMWVFTVPCLRGSFERAMSKHTWFNLNELLLCNYLLQTSFQRKKCKKYLNTSRFYAVRHQE